MVRFRCPFRLAAVILAVLASAVAGCSSSSSRATVFADGGGSGGQAGGAGSGGGPGDAGFDVAAPTKEGLVQLYQFHAVNAAGSTLALSVQFPSGIGPDCSTVEHGPCIVVTCTGDTPPGPVEAAGDITVANENTAAALPKLSPEVEQHYLPQVHDLTTEFAQTGDPINIQASGGLVPGFQASVPLPTKASLSTATSQLSTVKTSSDYAFAWTGGGAGQPVLVRFFGSAGTRITCEFASSSGQGSVPMAALAALSGSGAATVYITNLAQTTVNAGDYAVDVRVERALYTDQNKGALLNNLPVQN
ncbi:MAG TPA: hypothetical protein PKA88_37715 [Polyangiaceae bacterium]|nr:hypothetical protein [Polyangiaceae bacterium]HMR74104.1 hypothetical protein [Polyangiaceae bacterium]